MKITRRQLRQLIRESIILSEAANTPTMLPDDVVVVISRPVPNYVNIYYGNRNDPKVATTHRSEGRPWGRVTFGNTYEGIGECDGAMKIGNATASPGWGPLLYDVAMEYATQNANGLIADRDGVSPMARGVWRYYLENRPDVTVHQLDDLINTLTYPPEDGRTPIESDNCSQKVAKYSGGWNSNPTASWINSPLSKRYTKEPAVMNALKVDGKLVIL